MNYSALHESVHGEILCIMYLLSFVWQVLAVAQAVDPLNWTNEDTFDRDDLFLFQSTGTQHQLPRYRTASPKTRSG
jgi:hypothetical protein